MDMAEMLSPGVVDTEEIDDDDVEEDEHLYQFAINFTPTATGALAPSVAQQLNDYDSSDSEDGAQGRRANKSKALRKPKSVSNVEFSNIAGQAPGHTLPEGIFTPAVTEEDMQAHVATEQDQIIAEVMKYATAVSAVDWGSTVQIKQGTAGATADKDKFPFFNKTLTKWLYIGWDDEPALWVLLFLDKRIDEYENVWDETPSESKLPLSDISEVYLELAPSTSFRVYLSADRQQSDVVSPQDALVAEQDMAQDAVGADDASNTDSNTQSASTGAGHAILGTGAVFGTAPVVLRITPQPSVRGHATMWVDAIYAAMQLQCFEPPEEVYELRRRFYKLKEQEKGNQPIEGALMEGEGGEGKESSVNLDNLRYAVRVWRAGTEDAAEAPVGGSDRGSLTDLEAGTATHAPTRSSTNRLSASFRFYDIYGGGSPSAGGTAPRPDVRDAGDGSGGNAGSAGSGEQCCVVS